MVWCLVLTSGHINSLMSNQLWIVVIKTQFECTWYAFNHLQVVLLLQTLLMVVCHSLLTWVAVLPDILVYQDTLWLVHPLVPVYLMDPGVDSNQAVRMRL